MEVVEVKDEQTTRAFLEVSARLNRSDPNYIRPLDRDIESVFDPRKNKAFRHGSAVRWLLRESPEGADRRSGGWVGRIAAFVNRKYKNKSDEQPTGGIGFFECINDQGAANLLFDKARDWLAAQGMKAMDGPINFGERDRWWGLIVDGFMPPLYGMNYNPPFYKNLMETYGFQPFFHQICFGIRVTDRLPEKFYKRHEELVKTAQVNAQHFRKKDLEKFADDFVHIYNKAWKSHAGGKDLHRDQARAMFHQMKPVIDDRLIWFAYHGNEPIGCWLNLPELNQYFKHFNGRFGRIEKLRFLWLRWRGVCTKFTGIVFGVVPEWQGRGVEGFIFLEAAELIQVPGIPYRDFEMQWIGDFNPKMLNLAKGLGAQQTRRLTTYRYLFDRTQPFKRHPMVD